MNPNTEINDTQNITVDIENGLTLGFTYAAFSYKASGWGMVFFMSTGWIFQPLFLILSQLTKRQIEWGVFDQDNKLKHIIRFAKI